MNRVELRELEDDIIKLDMSLSLFMVVKDGLQDLLDHNEKEIDDALSSILNLQRTAVESLGDKFSSLIHSGCSL